MPAPRKYRFQETEKHIEGLDGMASSVLRTARVKGFYPTDEGQVPAAVANLHSEVSEIWEAYRINRLDKPCDKAKAMAKLGLPVLTCSEEEVADVIIRALELAHLLGIRVSRAVAVKDAYNRSRPYRHGGKIA